MSKKKKNKPNASVQALSFSNDYNTGIYGDKLDNLSISSGGLYEAPTNSAELMDLYIQGKDVLKDRQEYLEVIMRLPFVKNDNLKAVEVFERWKKTQNFLNKSEVENE